MSDKQKFPLAEARAVAESLMAELTPACARIVIAGSIRRDKPLVGDIGLLYIPKYRTEPSPEDMFANVELDMVNFRLNHLLASRFLEARPNINGQTSWGPKNKLARHVASGIPVDLFATIEEAWWVSLVIRTGSKETNLRLTTGAQRLGGTLHAYGSGVTKKDGRAYDAHSEQEVFELCGVPYIEPKCR